MGETIRGRFTIDEYGDNVQATMLPGDHLQTRHNAMLHLLHQSSSRSSTCSGGPPPAPAPSSEAEAGTERVSKRLRLDMPAQPGKRRAAWKAGQEGRRKRSRTSAGPCTALVPYTASPQTGGGRLGLPRALTLHLALPAVPSSLAPSSLAPSSLAPL